MAVPRRVSLAIERPTVCIANDYDLRVFPYAQVIIAGAPASGKGTQVHTWNSRWRINSVESDIQMRPEIAHIALCAHRQCEMIVEKYGLAHISAGDLLRAEVAAGTEAGKTAKKFMDSGDLVPDEVGVGPAAEPLWDRS